VGNLVNRFDTGITPGTILPKGYHCSLLNPHMDTVCKHPKVRVVAREEDVEYVECLDCGQVFDAQEYRDMEIEEVLEKAEDDK
jgi:Zn ribbon nucleic-acid-binding protein